MSSITQSTMVGGLPSLSRQVPVQSVGKMRCMCGKQVEFKWVVGKHARVPQCIYMLYVLLGMNRCQYDEWKGTLVCY